MKGILRSHGPLRPSRSSPRRGRHLIVSGLGATPTDSVGYPWNSHYTIPSGNLLADFRFNVTAESQGRLQVTRLYELTQDAGVSDMLSFLIARDTMHQNQWLAAIEELELDGAESTPVPQSFPREREMGKVAYQYWNCSEGSESKAGRWASGRAPDGKGDFEYLDDPKPMGEAVEELAPVNVLLHSTPKEPVTAVASD
jgi:Mn-containing catalase